MLRGAFSRRGDMTEVWVAKNSIGPTTSTKTMLPLLHRLASDDNTANGVSRP